MFDGTDLRMDQLIHPYQLKCFHHHHRCHHPTLHLSLLGPHQLHRYHLHVRSIYLMLLILIKGFLFSQIHNNLLQNIWIILLSLVNSSPSPYPNESIENDDKESIDEELVEPEPDHIHRVKINTHGRKLSLKLSPIQHLVSKRSALEDNTWFADGYPSNVSYTPSPKVIDLIYTQSVSIFIFDDNTKEKFTEKWK